ncbi:protein kinase (macronuclear) [Tetrahymena thermophila SB210]|uniref:Protein kinase n=1 Tax=Tetrahymena thermophila (strain SB210) TaxID=312017 RepID=Q23RC8_TETTS|nr:protein kinase [Tetrahymena thermophila SB210]EAR99120.2 protein kinase [Tetrahymena thermophila SB210]|eukprot:XP_001019365.2 protein kinase [Tetrahymena thermophila SB210]
MSSNIIFKQMYGRTFFNNSDDLKKLKVQAKDINLREETISIKEEDINKKTLLRDFFHDLFQIQASTTSKHLFHVFISSLNFVLDQTFTENKKFYLIDLSQIYLIRDNESETLKLYYSNRGSCGRVLEEMEYNKELTKYQALTINLYLQINLIMMCIIAKEEDDDDERQRKIKDFKEINSKFILYIQSQTINEKTWVELANQIKLNCQVNLNSLINSRLRNKIKGLKNLTQIIYNHIKNFSLNFLESPDYLKSTNDKLELINDRQILFNEIMLINQQIPKTNEMSDSEFATVNINQAEELKLVYTLIMDEFENQNKQKTKQYDQIKNKMQRTKTLIESIFQANSQTIFNSVLNDEKDSSKKLQYVVTFKMFDHWDHFLDLCVIKLTKDYFKCTIHFCKENYEPIIIPDKLTRIQVSRLFIKKVSKIGGFVINPISGQITFTYCTYNNLSKYSEEQVDNFLIRVIKSIFSTAFFMINMYMLSLYVKIGLISMPIYKQLEEILRKNQQNNKKDRTIFLPELTIRRLNNAIDLLENSVKPFAQFQEEDIFKTRVDINDRQEILKCLDVIEKKNSREAESQLEYIKVIDYDEKKLKKISAGGFSDIFQTELNFISKSTEQTSCQNFAIKVQKKDPQARDTEKIEKEVNVIKHIVPRSNFITRYYFDVETKDRLYMDLYFYSMGSYAYYHNSIMSLNKRVQMVLQVAQGVKFLQSIDIYHLDLKPPNILLDGEQNIKICDFGESYCIQNIGEQGVFQRAGRTLPYSPIESLSGNTFSPASDVYSIGAIISEIIFDKKLIEFKRINQQKLQSKLNQRNYRLIYSDLVVKEFGIKQIMKILKVLMLKCVNPDPNCRPHIEYLIAILYLILKVLSELY